MNENEQIIADLINLTYSVRHILVYIHRDSSMKIPLDNCQRESGWAIDMIDKELTKVNLRLMSPIEKSFVEQSNRI